MKNLLTIFSVFSCIFCFGQIQSQILFNENANRLTVFNGLSLWFDAADAGSIIKDATNKVSVWQDKSSNANHALQPTSANQPTYTVNQQNGLAAIIFPGTPSTQFFVGTKNGNYQTIIIVRNVAIAAASYQTIFAAPANSDFSLRINGGYSGLLANTAYDGDGPNVNDWTSGNSGKVYVNSVKTPTIPLRPNYHIAVVESASVLSNTTFSISNGNTTSPWKNRGISDGSGICELIVYNRTISATERRSIEEYLARKWKINITPAITIP